MTRVQCWTTDALPPDSRLRGWPDAVAAGESVLVDARIPCEFDFGAGLDELPIELPSDWLAHWLPDPARVLGRPLNAQQGWGLALRGLQEALTPAAVPQVTAGHALARRCLDVIRLRCHEHGLPASQIASACGISLRTLHRAFAALGKTFASELMRERTAAAARMLAERRFRNLTVAEIGRRCGFTDDSHFARQYRRWHGQAPGQFRRTAAKTPAPPVRASGMEPGPG